jgi:hypothetical protein
MSFIKTAIHGRRLKSKLQDEGVHQTKPKVRSLLASVESFVKLQDLTREFTLAFFRGVNKNILVYRSEEEGLGHVVLTEEVPFFHEHNVE